MALLVEGRLLIVKFAQERRRPCITGDLSLFLVLAGPAVAQEDDGITLSVLDLVHDCDLLTAHPDDVNRHSDGVADDQIIPALAIPACEQAAVDDAGNPRYEFQLGRALLAGQRREDALARLTSAADRNYPAAWAYLDDIYQFGLGVPVDPQKAFESYSKALAGGFETAQIQIDQLQFNPTLYTAEFLPAFFSGNFDEIRNKANDTSLRWLVRNYVFNVVVTMMNECGPILEPASVPRLYRYRYPTGWTADADADVAVAIQTSISEYDAATLLRRHGCDGAVAKHVFANINSFFETSQ